MTEENKQLTRLQGPFSTERYDASDALQVGLPTPEGLNLLVKFCEQMVGTPFIPKALNAGANPAGNILAVVLTGREEGFGPMEALRSYWISPDGRLAKYADAVMAKMRRAGFKFPVKEFTAQRAYLKAVRPDGDEYESSLTIEEVPGGLKSKQIWKDWPQRMLKARVVGDVYRFLAADLGGPTYTAEELQDLEPEPASTMAPATEDDKARVERIAAAGLQVTVRPKTEPPPEAVPLPEAPTPPSPPPPVPVTVEVKPEAPPQPPATATGVRYQIYVVPPNQAGEAKAVECHDEPAHEVLLSAVARAKLLAQEHGCEYVVMEVEPQTGTRMVVERIAPNAAAPPPAPATVKVTNGAREAMVNRLKALGDKIGMAHAKAQPKFNLWLAGWFACEVKALPKGDPAVYETPLDELEAQIAREPQRFRDNPAEAGRAQRAQHEDMLQFCAKMWPSESRNQQLALTLARQWGHSREDFQAWVERNELDFMPATDSYAFFRLALRTREAGALLKPAKQYSLSIAKLVDQIEVRGLECKLEEAKPEAVEQCVKRMLADMPKEARRQSEPPEAPPAATEEAPPADAPAGGLFDDWS